MSYTSNTVQHSSASARLCIQLGCFSSLKNTLNCHRQTNPTFVGLLLRMKIFYIGHIHCGLWRLSFSCAALYYSDQFSYFFSWTWTQHGGDGANATAEPGLTGRAQGGPTGPHESIQGRRDYMMFVLLFSIFSFESSEILSGHWKKWFEICNKSILSTIFALI